MRKLLLSTLVVCGLSSGASAATIFGLDGSVSTDYQTLNLQLVNGNCESNGETCGRLSPSDSTDFSLLSGGSFTLDSFGYKLESGNAVLDVDIQQTAAGPFVDFNTYTGSNGNNPWVNVVGPIADIFAIRFTNSGNGNLRFGDLVGTTTAPVPLPAAGGMLLLGLAGFGVMRSRKRSSQAA